MLEQMSTEPVKSTCNMNNPINKCQPAELSDWIINKKDQKRLLDSIQKRLLDSLQTQRYHFDNFSNELINSFSVKVIAKWHGYLELSCFAVYLFSLSSP